MSTGKAYSLDLRERVIAKVNAGVLTIKEVAALFNINVRTIYDWRKQLEKTGKLAPKSGYQKGHSRKITDIEAFRFFVKNNADLTLKEMANKFGDVSPKTVDRNLKKIGFSFKKKLLVIKNAMNKQEKSLKMNFLK